MNSVTASAPGKLMLFGDHAVIYGHPCIVTAVDQRLRVEVQRAAEPQLHLSAPDMGLSDYRKEISKLGQGEVPKSVAFIEQCYRRFLEHYPQSGGINVRTKSEFSSQFGFGSSSAVTVAFARAVAGVFDVTLTNKELFDFCYKAVLDVQGVGSGFDIASAIWGGTIYYVTPAKVVETLDCHAMPLIVGYTGIKADTPTLVRMVQSQYAEEKQAIGAVLSQMGRIVEQARKACRDQDWKQVGKLMNANQELLAFLKVSSVQLDRQIESACATGAYGAKLSGAGGGDCMIALADSAHRDSVRDAITRVGGTVMDVRIHAEGVRLEE